MADPEGFLKERREDNLYRPVQERIQDYSEVEVLLPETNRKAQASRCMNCGVPFCNWGCPLGSVIPEWQDKIHQGDWKAAYKILEATNIFPEFTGRICPAPCEMACVLGINDDPVTIRQNEWAVIERAFEEGYVQPRPPQKRTGKKVAVIGSGPAGLVCASILNRRGHTVVLYEASESVGGLLRFGVPDFKLDKHVIDRRVEILLQEGLLIETGVRVGIDLPAGSLLKEYDAVCLTIGAQKPRDLVVEGRNLKGIHFAMDYLTQQNRVVRGSTIPEHERIAATDKHVVVIGGGDTGSDCIGTATRQGARSISQLEILPQFPEYRTEEEPWPLFARLHKTTSSHEEGASREFNVATKKFIGQNGQVKKLAAVRVDWQVDDGGRYHMNEIPQTEFEIDAELVLLAAGFVHPIHEGLVTNLGIELDERGNVAVGEDWMTSVKGIFAGGDSKRGASLVVWAMSEGREVAHAVDRFLEQSSA